MLLNFFFFVTDATGKYARVSATGMQDKPTPSLIFACEASGLYYKNFTIINYSSVWSITYIRNLR